MTDQEQRLSDDQMRANIARLNAETEKLLAKSRKLHTEDRYYPVVVGATAVAAFIALAKLVGL